MVRSNADATTPTTNRLQPNKENNLTTACTHDKSKISVSSLNPGGTMISAGLFELVTLIALGFCVFKIFFDNIKRGGILLIQLAVGSLYMFPYEPHS